MADEKITDLTALAVTPASGDLVEIVDVSDTSTAPAGAGGSNKKITWANLISLGSAVQAWDADLDAFAGLTSGANLMPYYTGSNTMGTADFLNWGTWAGTWTGLGPGNPSGAGTATYEYAQVGKAVTCRVSLLIGISGTVGNNPSIVLPVSANTTLVNMTLGWGRFQVAGTVYACAPTYNATDRVGFRVVSYTGAAAGTAYATLVAPTAAIPNTWAAGDRIDTQFTYRAA